MKMKIRLARTSDIPEGGSISVKIPEGIEIALFKSQNEIFALDNACPHMGGPLCEGEIEGGTVSCPWHGWQFDIKTGLCQTMPGEDARKIPIEIMNEEVYLLQ